VTDHAALKKYALITVTLASFLTPFMGSAINVALPEIGKELHGSALLLSWTATSYILASAAFLLPFGRVADIYGRRKVFVWGIGLFSLSSFFCGMAHSLTALILFRTLQGVGGAMIYGISTAILTSVFPPEERGKVLGINIGTVYAGLSMGPVLGGVMSHNLGWESIFFFTAALGFATFFIGLIKLKEEWTGAQGEKFDFAGSFLCMAGIVSLLYGISSFSAGSWAKFLAAAGFLILVLFSQVEKKNPYPLLNFGLFKNITFTFSNIAALINYSATYAVGFLISVYLQVGRGLDAQAAGLVLLVQPATQALLSPLTGALSDRIESRILASLGMALTTAGLLVFAFISSITPFWLIVINLALLGIGFGFFSSPNSNAIMGSVEKRFYGIASSTMSTMRNMGQAASMAVVTLILTLHIGNAELNPELAPELIMSARTAFTVFSIICGIGIFASWARGNMHQEEKRHSG